MFAFTGLSAEQVESMREVSSDSRPAGRTDDTRLCSLYMYPCLLDVGVVVHGRWSAYT